MKKVLRIILPIVLTITILLGIFWYLFIYDRAFTRDVLLHCARHFEKEGNMETASWFYDRAYDQGSGNDEIAVELARQYIASGNYTQAEVTLHKAIKDGAGATVYIALSKVYVEQDKLLDAVDLLDKISDPAIKEEIEAQRPQAPTAEQSPGFYNQYISVTIESDAYQLYVSADGDYPSVNGDKYTTPISLTDGENVIYALAVSENGLVSSVSIFGYTVGGVIEEISFSDASIENTIRQLLNAPENKVLYSNDLWSISEFTVPTDATNYSDLRHMAFLKKLTIEDGVSEQLSFLPHLTTLEELIIRDTIVTYEEIDMIGSISSLKKLSLNNCQLSSITGLEKLSELTYLDLGYNTIRNISAISSMTQLRELHMPHNALQDLAALTACTKLSTLDVSYNSIATIDPIALLSALNKLDISHNLVIEILPISQLSLLSELRMAYNQVTDLSSVSNCSKLTYVDISNNNLTDISALDALTSIYYLNFSHNAVTELPTWPNNSALITIDGSYNQLSNISSLSNLQCINNILMDYNENISSITELASCPTLIQVNVYGTKVTDVEALTEQSIIVNFNPVQ